VTLQVGSGDQIAVLPLSGVGSASVASYAPTGATFAGVTQLVPADLRVSSMNAALRVTQSPATDTQLHFRLYSAATATGPWSIRGDCVAGVAAGGAVGSTVDCATSMNVPLSSGSRAVLVVSIVSASDPDASITLSGQASISLGVS
jgi:hypothetical protein